MGTSREITVEGIVTIANVGVGNLYKYARDLVGLGNTSLVFGMQGNSTYGQYYYVPESLNRGITPPDTIIYVVISEVSVKSEMGNPNALHYSITMMEYGTLV
jgi:hypothetical protein